MGRRLMSAFCLMERLAFTLQRDPLGRTDTSILAQVALFKVHAIKMLEFVAQSARELYDRVPSQDVLVIDLFAP